MFLMIWVVYGLKKIDNMRKQPPNLECHSKVIYSTVACCYTTRLMFQPHTNTVFRWKTFRMPSKKLESMSFVHGTTQRSDILDVLREELFKKINAHNEINATLDRYRMRTECTD